MGEWFSDWFDSKYYHILYKNRDNREAERFLSKLCSYLRLSKDSRVLDLACGKGRHSVYLNSLGCDVLGLDLSPNSIEEAALNSNETLSFGVHDMREPFGKGKFDAIFNVFTSFGYFHNEEEDIQTLKNVYNSLEDDGVFVLDFLNVEYIENNLVVQETKLVNCIYFHLHRFFKNGSLYKDIRFTIDSKNFYFQERVDAIKYFKFLQYFETVGFKIKDVFGDYDLSPFDRTYSKRLIIVAEKSE